MSTVATAKAAEVPDLREWLAAVESFGELQTIKGADWNLELGGIIHLNVRRRPNKALLFDEIKDHAPGFRVLSCSVDSVRRIALTHRLSGEISNHQQLVDAMRGKPAQWINEAKNYSPRFVSSGPVFEETYSGQQVDLMKFPTPFWHELDGGRYIGTACAVITSDPESDWVNMGAYRIMVINGKRVTVMANNGQHAFTHIQKWFEREGRCPIAISLGHEPLIFAVSGLEVPTGLSEYNVAGAIMKRPVDVIKAPATGLPIPAASEVVVEGWLYPGKTDHEGPFGEWQGYYAGGIRTTPYLEPVNLFHRHNPILLSGLPSKPPYEYSYWRCVLKSAIIHEAMTKAGVQDVKQVWPHECSGGRQLLVVAIKQRFCGHSRQAATIAAQLQASAYCTRYVVVVDDDIDASNLEEVMWAVATRSDPAEDIEVMRKTWGSEADTMRKFGTSTFMSRAIIDACKPYDWINDFPKTAEPSEKLYKAIIAKWGSVLGK